MSNYAFINCNVIDGNLNSGVLGNMTILVKDGKIYKMGESSKITVSAEYETVNIRNNFVMPGLINAHVHLFGSGKPMKAIGGGKAQERLAKILSTRIGRKVLYNMVKKHAITELHSGVTTVRAVGDLLYSDVKVRNDIEDGNYLGPRLLAAGSAIAVTGGHGSSSFANVSDSPWEARKCVRRNVKEQVDLIKICVTGGVTDSRKIGDAGKLQMTLEEVSAVCEEAHKIGLFVAAHAESIEGVRIALLGGVDTIEHGSEFDEEIISLFNNNPKALRGYSSLITTLHPAIPLYKLDSSVTKLNPISQENDKIVLDRMIRGGKQAIEAGIRIGLGTDASCPFVTQYNTWRELVYIVEYLGVTKERAIYHATKGNAEILGIDNETGSIEEGKSADLIILESNPLEDLRALSNVSKVVIRGNLIDKPLVKKIKQVDEALEKINI